MNPFVPVMAFLCLSSMVVFVNAADKALDVKLIPLAERTQGSGPTAEATGRMVEHLKVHGIDFGKTPLTLGATLAATPAGNISPANSPRPPTRCSPPSIASPSSCRSWRECNFGAPSARNICSMAIHKMESPVRGGRNLVVVRRDLLSLKGLGIWADETPRRKPWAIPNGFKVCLKQPFRLTRCLARRADLPSKAARVFREV